MVRKILSHAFVYIMLFLMYLPILVLVAFSFTASESIGNCEGFDLSLYVTLFENEALMEAVLNTILIAFVSAIISTLIGTLGAIGTFYSSKRNQQVVETMTQLPVVNAEIVMALSIAVLCVALGLSFLIFAITCLDFRSAILVTAQVLIM